MAPLEVPTPCPCCGKLLGSRQIRRHLRTLKQHELQAKAEAIAKKLVGKGKDLARKLGGAIARSLPSSPRSTSQATMAGSPMLWSPVPPASSFASPMMTSPVLGPSSQTPYSIQMALFDDIPPIEEQSETESENESGSCSSSSSSNGEDGRDGEELLQGWAHRRRRTTVEEVEDSDDEDEPDSDSDSEFSFNLEDGLAGSDLAAHWEWELDEEEFERLAAEYGNYQHLFSV